MKGDPATHATATPARPQPVGTRPPAAGRVRIAQPARFPDENPNPVLRISRRGHLLYHNNASEPLLAAWGCVDGRLLGGAWAELGQRAIESGGIRQADTACGAQLFSVTFVPLAGADYVNVYAVDITERKRLEEARLHAERLAVIGTMSARLAHEIRNPLGTVLINLGLLRAELEGRGASRAVSQEAGVLLQAIETEMRRVQQVSDGYLRFARLPKPSRRSTRLTELLTRELEFVRPLCDAAGVTLSTELAAGLPPIRADERQLWQALLNILLNALEAMTGGGTLVVGTSLERQQILLTVADTGCGMNAEQQARVFEPFFTTKPGGTGLGMALTKQIIMEHNGSIDCRSVPGQGTTFSIRLPGL